MRSRILHLLVVSSVWWGVLYPTLPSADPAASFPLSSPVEVCGIRVGIILLLITGIVAVRRRRKNARTPTA